MNDETYVWSEHAELAMRTAGWRPGRRVDVEPWRAELESEGFRMHPAAANFLAEFGGLEVRTEGAGRDVARLSFDLDPLRCQGQQPWFAELDHFSAGELFPVGEEADGNASLAIDRDGVVFLLFNFRAVRIGGWRAATGRLIDGEREQS